MFQETEKDGKQEQQPKEKEEAKFQPFAGKKYSLRGQRDHESIVDINAIYPVSSTMLYAFVIATVLQVNLVEM